MGTPVTFEMKGIVLLDLGFTSITYKVESSVSLFLEEYDAIVYKQIEVAIVCKQVVE